MGKKRKTDFKNRVSKAKCRRLNEIKQNPLLSKDFEKFEHILKLDSWSNEDVEFLNKFITDNYNSVSLFLKDLEDNIIGKVPTMIPKNHALLHSCLITLSCLSESKNCQINQNFINILFHSFVNILDFYSLPSDLNEIETYGISLIKFENLRSSVTYSIFSINYFIQTILNKKLILPAKDILNLCLILLKSLIGTSDHRLQFIKSLLLNLMITMFVYLEHNNLYFDKMFDICDIIVEIMETDIQKCDNQLLMFVYKFAQISPCYSSIMYQLFDKSLILMYNVLMQADVRYVKIVISLLELFICYLDDVICKEEKYLNDIMELKLLIDTFYIKYKEELIEVYRKFISTYSDNFKEIKFNELQDETKNVNIEYEIYDESLEKELQQKTSEEKPEVIVECMNETITSEEVNVNEINLNELFNEIKDKSINNEENRLTIKPIEGTNVEENNINESNIQNTDIKEYTDKIDVTKSNINESIAQVNIRKQNNEDMEKSIDDCFLDFHF